MKQFWYAVTVSRVDGECVSFSYGVADAQGRKEAHRAAREASLLPTTCSVEVYRNAIFCNRPTTCISYQQGKAQRLF